jgi:hypothetical protein
VRQISRGAACVAVTLLVGACAGPIDVPTPTTAVARPAQSTAPEPTPVVPANGRAAETFVPAGAAPQVACGGGLISGADIDYLPDAQGVGDILAATRGFPGVLPTDVIVVEPAVTVVVRDGRPIWRGEWADSGRGYLLASTASCTDAGIRFSP